MSFPEVKFAFNETSPLNKTTLPFTFKVSAIKDTGFVKLSNAEIYKSSPVVVPTVILDVGFATAPEFPVSIVVVPSIYVVVLNKTLPLFVLIVEAI